MGGGMCALVQSLPCKGRPRRLECQLSLPLACGVMWGQTVEFSEPISLSAEMDLALPT